MLCFLTLEYIYFAVLWLITFAAKLAGKSCRATITEKRMARKCDNIWVNLNRPPVFIVKDGELGADVKGGRRAVVSLDRPDSLHHASDSMRAALSPVPSSRAGSSKAVLY